MRRAEMAYERGGDFLEDARKRLNREATGPRQSRFSIGSAPLTSNTKSDAQISGGETRQDYKDTRRFPLADPSGALLFLPVGVPVSCGCYVRVYLIPRQKL
ncbi:hypothetical protein SQ44_19445, partial [Klebsiella pneumoniae]